MRDGGYIRARPGRSKRNGLKSRVWAAFPLGPNPLACRVAIHGRFAGGTNAAPILCLTVLGLALLGGPAAAQGDYPNRTVRIIVPATPGGGADTFARLVAQHLGQELKQQVVVENRPGGGTMTAMEFVANAPPDGHTLYLSPSTTTFMHLVRKSMPWDVRKAFAPVTMLAEVPFALVINPSTKARSVKEFIALAKREATSCLSAHPAPAPACR